MFFQLVVKIFLFSVRVLFLLALAPVTDRSKPLHVFELRSFGLAFGEELDSLLESGVDHVLGLLSHGASA